MVKHISHNSTDGLPKQDTDQGEDRIMSGQDTCNYSVMNFQQEYQLGAIMCVFMDSLNTILTLRSGLR